MNNRIKTKTIPIETKLDDVVLKGELEFWAKDYSVRLKEPFENECGAHLMYSVPVKYVFEKSKNPTCNEIELKEKSKEILKSIYLNKINNRGCSYE